MGCYAFQIVQCTLYLLVSNESDVFDLLDHFVVIYLNDILVFSESFSNNLAYFSIVL